MNNVTRNNFLFVEKNHVASFTNVVISIPDDNVHPFLLSYPSLRNIATMGEIVSMKVIPMAMMK